ncbi:MAG: hypothetical protein ABT00_11445 [Bordetella sp. SCN 68-11]|nr:MAG: hypothetical protein ABT00_11445 [Bordetella sp. SCN 68-11]
MSTSGSMAAQLMRRQSLLGASRERTWLISSLFTVLVLAVWEALTMVGVLPAYIYGPIEIARAFVELARGGDLAAQTGPSLYRALSGFFIGSAIGVMLGLLAGVSRVFRDLFDLTQSFTHPIPKIALFPAIAVLLGFTDKSRILVIAISAFYPSYLNAMNGALGINARLLWVARNAGASKLRTFFQVVVPAAMPRALVGVRISLMISFVLMVATEVVGHSNGLGAGLMEAYRDGEYGAMYAGIVAGALCGVVSIAVLQRVARVLGGGRDAGGAGHG